MQIQLYVSRHKIEFMAIFMYTPWAIKGAKLFLSVTSSKSNGF